MIPIVDDWLSEGRRVNIPRARRFPRQPIRPRRYDWPGWTEVASRWVVTYTPKATNEQFAVVE